MGREEKKNTEIGAVVQQEGEGAIPGAATTRRIGIEKKTRESTKAESERKKKTETVSEEKVWIETSPLRRGECETGIRTGSGTKIRIGMAAATVTATGMQPRQEANSNGVEAAAAAGVT